MTFVVKTLRTKHYSTQQNTNQTNPNPTQPMSNNTQTEQMPDRPDQADHNVKP